MVGMCGRAGRRHGQSVLEYLVIMTVVVLAILGIRQTVTNKSNALFNEAADKVGEAATSLKNLKVEKP